MKISKKLLGAGATAATSLLAFGAIFTSILSSDFNETEKLKLATRWLDADRWDLAGGLAQELESSIDPELNSAWNYVQGVSQLNRIIDDLDSYQNRLILIEVTKHLEKSRELGFPLGYRGKGNYYLGVCQFNTYHWEESIESLNRCLSEFPEVRSDSMRMIITAHLRKPQPNPSQARQVLEQWLQMPGLSPREVAQSQIAQAQLALHSGSYQDCNHWLSKIPPGIPEHYEGLKWKSLCLISESTQANSNSTEKSKSLDEAQRILQRLIVASDTPMQIRRQAFYLSGRALRHLGQHRRAVSVLSAVRQQNPFSAEAIAAGLEEVEILMDLGKSNEVIIGTRQLLHGISDMRLYNEYWVSEDELRTRLTELGNRLRQKEEYQEALELADQMIIAFPPSHALRLQANTLANWGTSVLRESSPDDLKARSIAADIFARAGECCERLAQIELRSRDYLNIVWTAVENYQRAGRVDDANRMIQEYLKYESRSKLPRALLALGRNYIAEADWQSSLIPLQQCLTDFPASPNSYEARLLAAQALSELNERDQAIELLSSNLWDYELHPDSPIWKDSFIELANLQFQRGQAVLAEVQNRVGLSWKEAEPILLRAHDELKRAAEHLSEAAHRYPNDHRRNYTRYQLARAYQLAAELPSRSLKASQSLSDATIKLFQNQKNQLLEKSVVEYEALHQAIILQRESNPHDNLDPFILRGALFGQADVLTDLGNYEAAIEAYRAAAAYYSNRPEALEALIQIADCYRKLGREDDAKKTVRQAELVLHRIPAERDASFVTTTRGDRNHWEQSLNRLKEWN